jgi:hypothetical protein
LGVGFLLAFALIIASIHFVPAVYDHLFVWLRGMHTSTFSAPPREISEYVFRWYIAAILINALSIFFAILLLLQRGVSPVEALLCWLLGGLAFATMLALVLVFQAWFTFHLIALATYGTYILLDAVGIWSLRNQGGRNHSDWAQYYYPCACLDVPTALVTLLFLVVFWNSKQDAERLLHDGISVGVLVFSGVVYVTIMTFVIPSHRETWRPSSEA